MPFNFPEKRGFLYMRNRLCSSCAADWRLLFRQLIKLPKFILTFCNRLPLYRITKTLEKFKYRGKLRCRTRHFPEHRAFNAILATSRKTNLGSSGSEARLGWVLHTPPHVWAETSCYQTIERQGWVLLITPRHTTGPHGTPRDPTALIYFIYIID